MQEREGPPSPQACTGRLVHCHEDLNTVLELESDLVWHTTCEEKGIRPKSIIGQVPYQQSGIAQGKQVSSWMENPIIYIMAIKCTFGVYNVVKVSQGGGRTANPPLEILPTDPFPDQRNSSLPQLRLGHSLLQEVQHVRAGDG